MEKTEEEVGRQRNPPPPKTYFCFWSLYLIRKPLIGLTHYKVVLVANMNEP